MWKSGCIGIAIEEVEKVEKVEEVEEVKGVAEAKLTTCY